MVPPEPRINAARLAHSRTIGNPRFNFAGKRSRPCRNPATRLAEALGDLRFSLLDGEGQCRLDVILLPFQELHGGLLPCSTIQVWLATLDESQIILGMTLLQAYVYPFTAMVPGLPGK